MRKTKNEAKQLAGYVIEGMLDKKGKDIVSINLQKLGSSVADYFVICHGTSTTQVGALAESVEEIVKKNTGESPITVEGIHNSEWVLLDYSDVVVHVFLENTRTFFQLEKLWADGEIKQIIEI